MRHDKGFSLIELLVVMAISSLIMVFLSTTVLSFYRVSASTEKNLQANQGLRNAMALIVEAVKMAGYDPQEKALTAVTECAQQQLSWNSDFDGDGVLSTPEKSTLFLAGQNLQLNHRGTNKTLFTPVKSIAVSCFDQLGSPVTDPAQTRQVRVSVITAASGNASERTATITVLPPNLQQ